MLQHDLPGVGDHGTIVTEELPVRDGERRTPILAHQTEHLLQARIRADAADEQHLTLTGMCKRPLGHLDTHRKRGLLQAIADILECSGAVLSSTDESGEGKIHPLHRVGKLDILPPPGKPLDGRAARVREAMTPCELINRVPKPDIQRLPEDPVAATQVAEHLRIRAARVEDDRVRKTGCPSPDLDMRHTVVDADERHSERDREGSCGGRHRPQGWTETGPLGEGNGTDPFRFREHSGYDLLHHRRVVLRGLPWVDTPSRRGVGRRVEGDQVLSEEGGAEVPRSPLEPQHQTILW